MLPRQKTDTDIVLNAAPSRGFHSQSRQAMGYFVLFTLILAVLMALFIIIVDPLQFYHRATWYSPVFSKQERYQNPGLAKNFDYDTIIIGTSMTENFLPSEVSQSLGGKAMKLSIEGSTAEEHYKIAKLALKTGKVKKVLWGLDYFSLKNNTEEEQQTFPHYLYDDKLWNDYKYIFNSSVYAQFAISIKDMLQGKTNDLEHLNNWNDESTFSKERTAKSYYDHSASEVYFGMNEEDIPVLQQRFNTYVGQLLADYPDVQFYFYYPPYSVMRQAAWYNTNPKRFNNQLEMRKWMFQQINKHPNAMLYDFQSEADWTFNLDLYKDISHHSGAVNSRIVRSIGKNDAKYRVTEDNVELFNHELVSQTTSALMDKQGNVYAYKVKINSRDYPFSKRLIQGDGELFLPASETASSLRAAIAWDAAAKTAVFTTEQQRIELSAGNKVARVNGQEVLMTRPLLIAGGRAMVPIKFVAEQLGLETALHIEQRNYSLNINSL
ncbi:hypothetical protein J2Z22_004505 [Paenibacillus forsythiae]|uniref:Copper amine oxidase-like N-terminal domain-containing protein n=1 Tax=Paenibacillus forsythiae TaxID=365616 RepID=A0ABU3HGW3_9BACL|nr:copper amine oxidase N-terminal domain-containing protein [Paenibacillus forsythiae]MDT3428910.1 hypothetical protein [Paenibacillus forsythiae]